MTLLNTLGPAVLLLALFACTPDQLEEADQLERDLLITWIALERNDQAVAATYNQRTQQSWDASQAMLEGYPLSPDQKRAVSLLRKWMDNLDFSIRYGQRDNALTTISAIQQYIGTIRPSGEELHPVDQLYQFQFDWAAVREASSDQMMCLLSWNEFEGLYETADEQWSTYQRVLPQAATASTLPGLGSNSFEAEQSALALTKALEEFNLILRQGDHTLTTQPGNRIQALFINYLAVITEYPEAESLR